jgi:hypothetical protein
MAIMTRLASVEEKEEKNCSEKILQEYVHQSRTKKQVPNAQKKNRKGKKNLFQCKRRLMNQNL